MHMAVKTAMSLPPASPSCTICGTRPMAAPAAPSAVIGTETPWELVKPNSGCKINSSLSPMAGSSAMPS